MSTTSIRAHETGDKFIATFELVRPVENGEKCFGQVLHNPRQDIWWVKSTEVEGEEAGGKLLCVVDLIGSWVDSPAVKATHPDRGHMHERTEYDALEKALADKWEKDDRTYLLQCLTDSRATKRDRFIAATVIQWLGTNVGFGFIRECFADGGYAIIGSPTRPKIDFHSDPLLHAMHNAHNYAEYFRQVAMDAETANQLIFDMCEPS